jgi:hypothetical protein
VRYKTRIERIGENVGPVDWSHKIAMDKPAAWREAEKRPREFLYNGYAIIEICMYDGWPYWVPTPAIHFIGPLNSGEWHHFNSYGVSDQSIEARRDPQEGVG